MEDSLRSESQPKVIQIPGANGTANGRVSLVATRDASVDLSQDQFCNCQLYRSELTANRTEESNERSTATSATR